ncbi:hypothetical protein PG990_015281 [Apiospora arundinis]
MIIISIDAPTIFRSRVHQRPCRDETPPSNLITTGQSPPTSDEGFVQQGQIDWVALIKMNSTLAVDVLARLEGGGLQPFTYIGAMNLVSHFQMPERGRQRVWDAISGLKTYKAFKKALYFGFGYRSVFDLMTQSVSGLKVIALCSALGEMHSEPVAARVLSALWREFQFPEEVEPSHEQMKALIKVCGGALLTSPFVEIASHMMNNLPSSVLRVGCADPGDLSKTLRAVFDVTNGSKKSITIIGGASSLFIAAMAYWILDLSTHVENEVGDVLFSTSIVDRLESSKSPQIYVKYSLNSDSSTAVVSESTCILNSPIDMLDYKKDGPDLPCIRHRVLWDHCLSTAFGGRFNRLLGLENALGIILGSMARIYQGLAGGEPAASEYDRTGFIDFAHGNYGEGFAQSVGRIFPELDLPSLQNAMMRSVLGSFSEAEAKLEEAFETLRTCCKCINCGGEREDVHDIHDGHFRQYDGCYRQMAATIVDLISTISAVHNPHNISPTVDGLQWFYSTNDIFRSNRHDSGHKRLIEKRLVTNNGTLEGQCWWGEGCGELIQPTLILFVGSGPDSFRDVRHYRCLDMGRHEVAVARDGLVAYIEGLVTMSTSARSLRHINLVPGHIIRPGDSVLQAPRQYNSIHDLFEWPKPEIGLAKITQRDFAKFMADGAEAHELGEIEASSAWTVTPELTETHGTWRITFCYRVTGPVEAVIPPGRFTRGVLLHTALVSCSRGKCQPFEESSIKLCEVNKDWTVRYQTILQGNNQQPGVCCIWDHGSNSIIDKVVAFATVFQESQHDMKHISPPIHPILIRRDECLSCCLRALDQLSGRTNHIRHIMY